jgi:hypothetical protein
MIASMGAQAMGAETARVSTVEGAKSQARIEAMKREYMTKMFDEDIERLKPFYEAGKSAGVMYGDAVRNKLDPTKTGTYQQISKMISPELEGAPEYVKEEAFERLGAMEQQRQKSRLMDIQQIGLGSAGSAGTSGMNLGRTLAQSYGLSGGVMAQGAQSGAEQRQSMYNVAATQLGGMPSYFASGRQTPQQPQQNVGIPLGASSRYGGYA